MNISPPTLIPQAADTPVAVVDPSTGTCKYCGDPVPTGSAYCVGIIANCEWLDSASETSWWRRWAA